MTKKTSPSTINPEEIGRFSGLARHWWDPEGPMRSLHKINPARFLYIDQQLERHFGETGRKLNVLDIGCGAGMVSEFMAAKGHKVTGIDASPEQIEAAAAHAAESNLSIAYSSTSLEDMHASETRFDIVLALEILEHVANPALFVRQCAGMAKKGGLVIFSTLNRTGKAFALGILGGEYLLRWAPIGTHNWKAFIKPSELARMAEAEKLKPTDICGMVYQPLQDQFVLDPQNVAVNYFLSAEKN